MDETQRYTGLLTVAIITIALVSWSLPVSATTTPSAEDRLQSSTGTVTIDTALLVPTTSTSTSIAPTIDVTAVTSDDGGLAPAIQSDQRPHLAAVLGIVVLALLGSTLAVRNRLESRPTVERTSEATSNEDFMTDRERVRRLVTENGGRMKQADIVDSVEWSKAKVSRLLADLESEDEITKLRLGRENLICLRGQEPPASQSPDGAGSE